MIGNMKYLDELVINTFIFIVLYRLLFELFLWNIIGMKTASDLQTAVWTLSGCSVTYETSYLEYFD